MKEKLQKPVMTQEAAEGGPWAKDGLGAAVHGEQAHVALLGSKGRQLVEPKENGRRRTQPLGSGPGHTAESPS